MATMYRFMVNRHRKFNTKELRSGGKKYNLWLSDMPEEDGATGVRRYGA